MFEHTIDFAIEQIDANEKQMALVQLAEMQLALVGGGIGDVVFA